MIPVTPEPKELYITFHAYEKCAFCKQSTNMWHISTNTPVCSLCSKKHTVKDMYLVMSHVNLIERYKSSDIEQKFEQFAKRIPSFTLENKELQLKANDVIKFIGGYHNNIAYKSKILGFAPNGDAFLLWDCYWLNVDLTTRLIEKVK